MNKLNKVLICTIIVLFLILNITILILNKKDGNNFIGTYKTNNWNGAEAVLVLQKDRSMIHPSKYNGTWYYNEGKIYLEYDYEDTLTKSADEFVASYSNRNSQSTDKDYTKHKKQEVTIVDGGLILDGTFFEKLNK